MLREQLVSACTGKILDTVRSHRGWLSFVSTESQVDRQFFTRKKFQTLRFFRLVRALYVLAMKMDRDEFAQIGYDDLEQRVRELANIKRDSYYKKLFTEAERLHVVRSELTKNGRVGVIMLPPS